MLVVLTMRSFKLCFSLIWRHASYESKCSVDMQSSGLTIQPDPKLRLCQAFEECDLFVPGSTETNVTYYALAEGFREVFERNSSARYWAHQNSRCAFLNLGLALDGFIHQWYPETNF